MENSSQSSENSSFLPNASIRSGANLVRPSNRFSPRLGRFQHSPSAFYNLRSEHERRRRRITSQQLQQPQSLDLGQYISTNKRRRVEEGQAEMTQVPLELHSCDGGSYDGDRYYNYPSTEYCPENALRNDGSVYCTKNSRCNMILQHVDKKCFTLQRLIIRAPSSGYTSPDSVREGMIFVTMDDNNLLTRTNYSIRYEDYNDEHEDDSEDEIENRRAIRPSQTGPCDTPQADRESQPLIESSTTPGLLYRGRTANNLRNTDVGPSRIEATPDAAGIAAQIPLLEPHATFYNRDSKNKCVINFEPAISGRFILAKFFAGHMDDNIDIEFIGAYGYVGRRFFPATTPR